MTVCYFHCSRIVRLEDDLGHTPLHVLGSAWPYLRMCREGLDDAWILY